MENTTLFKQFAGADLDRLADCMKAIRKAGLQTTKHTQAGVNQSSGNVWVWDEDWVGCVYCSIGFNVAWSHSCPECGTETDFDSYAEMENFVEQHEGLCDDCHIKSVA
jgi:RecJ-like exonuclease